MEHDTRNPETRFLESVAELDEALRELRQLAEDHFEVDPESLNWGHVGTLSAVVEATREALRIGRELARVGPTAPPSPAPGRRARGSR